eukprot:8557682-Karenia_brevis.AAC.1
MEEDDDDKDSAELELFLVSVSIPISFPFQLNWKQSVPWTKQFIPWNPSPVSSATVLKIIIIDHYCIWSLPLPNFL